MLNRSGSSAYYSGGKRPRDSLQPQSQSTIRPFLMGSAVPRSPNQKRSRLSLGVNSGKTSSDLEWSSLLNFQTPLRSSTRSTALRRRETIHSLPGQLASPSLSTTVRNGVTTASPGFILRDRGERHSVARALKILDSRKRFRELSNNDQSGLDSEVQRESATSYPVENAHRKRRRLTINGSLEQMLQQEDAFASTSLGEIASKRNIDANDARGSSLVQKRIFTSAVIDTTSHSNEPSSKRSRPNASSNLIVDNGNLGVETGESRPGSSSNSVVNDPQSIAAQRRRLLSYMTPESVEARYAKRSAASDLARSQKSSRSVSRSTTPNIIRRSSHVANKVATTGAQTELSCNQTDVLQKSPVKDKEQKGDEEKSEAKVTGPLVRRPLSVADFVARLDRARTTSQPQHTEDTQRRTAADGQARRERLNRLRKLLSDVTQEPTPPTQPTTSTLGATVPSAQTASSNVGGSVLSALIPPTANSNTAIQNKNISFGFNPSSNQLLSGAASVITSKPQEINSIGFAVNPANRVATVAALPPNTTKSTTMVQPQGLANQSNNTNINVSLAITAPVTTPTTPSSGTSSLFGAPPSAPGIGITIPSITSVSNQVSSQPIGPTAAPAINSFLFGQKQSDTVKTSTASGITSNSGQTNQNPLKTTVTQLTGSSNFSFGKSQTGTSSTNPTLPNLSNLPPNEGTVAISSLSQTSKTVSSTIGTGNISFAFGQSASASKEPSQTTGTPLIFGQPNQSSCTKTSTAPTLPVSTPGQQQSTLPISTAAAFSFGQPTQTTTSLAAVTKPSAQFPFGRTNTDVAVSKPFAFGQPTNTSTTASPFTFGHQSETATTTNTNPTPFSFGKDTQSSTKSSGLSILGGQTSTTAVTPSTQFSFGQQPQPSVTKGSVSASSETGVGLSFGQLTKPSEPKQVVPSGSIFSFTKSSEPPKVTTGPTSGLFSFASTTQSDSVNPLGAMKAVNSTASVFNTTQSGNFSFGNQGNPSQSKAVNSTAAGLFSFGQSSNAASGGLFSTTPKPNVATTSSSSTGFSFGSTTSLSSATNATAAPTANSAIGGNPQPFAFGGGPTNGNPSSTATTNASFVFGSAPKAGFSFGQTNAGNSSGSSMSTSNAFSFGSNQPQKPQEQPMNDATINQVNKPNGGAGFTFHLPSGNSSAQTGSFSFGGSTTPSVPPTNPSSTPFAFGQQQHQPPTPASGNLFSQTSTATPRKKITSLLRKRATRK